MSTLTILDNGFGARSNIKTLTLDILFGNRRVTYSLLETK